MARSSERAVAAEPRLIAGRYRIESLLGRGGMGAVYAAFDTSSAKRLAVKVTSHGASPKVLELFKREFHTLHGLRHPNIIEVYDYGNDAEGLFYTMELLEGGDLGSAAPLPWRQVCSYLLQAATVLGLLHARRLLHRDLTPRNLWILPDGQLKLIDFGALCPFGVPTEVVGTPPFIAPEWLHDRWAGIKVDQRADVYALGALGYWLLTSAHAFPARSINDLERVWARQPVPPSSLARLVEGRGLEPIPAELDGLILSLLRREPGARPETTEVLVDRLEAISGRAADPTQHAIAGYVGSKAFVGRHVEQRRIAERLTRETGDAFVVEAGSGMGRSRLLEELSVIGRLAGATSVLVRGEPQDQAYGLASRIALALLDSLPHEAVAAAQGHEAILAQLSPDVQRRLEVQEPSALDATPRGRDRLQRALTEWVFALGVVRRILLLVDDTEQSDEESSAWLAALARHCAERRVFLVVALVVEPGVPPALHLQMLRRSAHVLSLVPLTAADTHELLHSVFGPALYLDRVTDVLHRVSQGSPAHCLELVEDLVERGLARYSEGRWVLPGQLSDAELPRNRSQMHLARLDRLGAEARSLAEGLSVHDGPLARPHCQAASELSVTGTDAALVELTLLGVLVESDQGYSFVHATVREKLYESLAGPRRERVHALLGAALLACAKDPIETTRAGLHLFCAGDVTSGERLIREAALELLQAPGRMHGAVPWMEEAVRLYRAAGADPEVLAAPLAVLGSASFFVDRRLADRHGRPALDALELLLRFDLARALRGYVGVHLALATALSVAATRRLGRRPAGMTVVDALRAIAGTVIALNGVATSSLDPEMTARCRRALEPLAGFSDRHIVGIVRRCIAAIGGLLSNEQSKTFADLKSLCAHLESDAPIRELTAPLRQEFLGGSLLSLGVMEGWRQSPAILAIADRIEPFGPMYALNADQLRSMYYGGRGDRLQSERYSQRVATRALQAGAAWQVVALEPIGLSFQGLWAHDVLLAKRAATELERLSRELPTFRHEARRARATFLVLTGRYHEVIELMTTGDEPASVAGWPRGQGILARAHNRIGEHARARELCQAALAGHSEEDLGFVLMFLHVQIELALANASLGELEPARQLIDRLLVRDVHTGPVALGTLHETRARVALIERDFETCRAHCDAMRRCFAATDLTTLHEVADRLIERVAVAEHGEETHAVSPAALLADDAHLMTRVRLLLSHTEGTFERRAQLGLQIAFDLTGAHTGFLLSPAVRGGLVTAGDEAPSRELVQWAEEELASRDADQTVVSSAAQTIEEQAPSTFGDAQYCVIPLRGVAALEGAPVALVLGFRGMQARAPSEEILALLARHLVPTQHA